MSSDPEGQGKETQKRQPPKPRPTIVRVFRALKRYENRRRRRAKSQHQANERMLARWTRHVGLFTGALVLVGIVTAVIFSRQLNVMQGQLDEMRTDALIHRNEVRARMQRNTKSWLRPTGLAQTTDFQNIGKSDAQEFSGWNEMKFFIKNDADRFDFRQHPDYWSGRQGVSVPSNDTVSVVTVEIPDSDVRRAINREGFIIHWGYIEYKDIFPEDPIHFLYWCVVLSIHPTSDGHFTIELPVVYRQECNATG